MLTKFLADPPIWMYFVVGTVMISGASVFGYLLWLGHDFEKTTMKEDFEAQKALGEKLNDFSKR